MITLTCPASTVALTDSDDTLDTAAVTAPSSPSSTTPEGTIPLRSTGAINSVAIPREVAGAESVSSLQTSKLPREVESAEIERMMTPAPMVLTAVEDDLPATLPVPPVVDHGAASTAVLVSPTLSKIAVNTATVDIIQQRTGPLVGHTGAPRTYAA